MQIEKHDINAYSKEQIFDQLQKAYDTIAYLQRYIEKIEDKK